MPPVKLYANLRTVAGKKVLNIPGKSIEDVLRELTRAYPALMPFLLENGKLRPRVILTLNGRTLDLATCMEISLSEQDQIAIFPPVAGG